MYLYIIINEATMRKNFGDKPWSYPQPVLMIATYNEDGTPDIMNAAWGEIVNVCADESVLTDGKIDPARLRPIVFDPVNHSYLELGAKVGDAFSEVKRLK